jgi:hypothetical protein
MRYPFKHLRAGPAPWISKETLDSTPELPKRVDFDDWEKYQGHVNLISTRGDRVPWLPAGYYKKIKGGKPCVLKVRSAVKGTKQSVWLEKPNVRVRAGAATERAA